MREHSRDRGRLEDIVKYAQNVNVIISGISFEEFTKDIRIYYSVMKNIEVIGEAANMLTRHFREIHAELPWRQIVSMRNVLVHGYAQVSDADLHTRPYLEVQRGPFEVSRLRCRRQAESKNVNGKARIAVRLKDGYLLREGFCRGCRHGLTAVYNQSSFASNISGGKRISSSGSSRYSS